MDAYINGTSGRGLVGKTPNMPLQLETQEHEFLRFVSSLVLYSKGIKVHLTVADITGDNEEFRREHKMKIQLARALIHRSRRNNEGEAK